MNMTHYHSSHQLTPQKLLHKKTNQSNHESTQSQNMVSLCGKINTALHVNCKQDRAESPKWGESVNM